VSSPGQCEQFPSDLSGAPHPFVCADVIAFVGVVPGSYGSGGIADGLSTVTVGLIDPGGVEQQVELLDPLLDWHQNAPHSAGIQELRNSYVDQRHLDVPKNLNNKQVNGGPAAHSRREPTQGRDSR